VLYHTPSEKLNTGRVPAPRKLLRSLRAIQLRADRIRQVRATLGAERRFCDVTYDTLSVLIDLGEKILPPHTDPRDARRVRKRKGAAGGAAP
jgi:hypothetical protein